MNQIIHSSCKCRGKSIVEVLKKIETIRETKSGSVSAEILNVLNISASRHRAVGTDVMHLNSLELKYLRAEDYENLAKIKAITITDDFIKIAGLELTRFDIQLLKFDQAFDGIYFSNDGKNTFFTSDVALLLSDKFDFTIPNAKQWHSILSAIPGSNAQEQIMNVISILNFNNSGFFRSIIGEIENNGKAFSYWVLDNNGDKLSGTLTNMFKSSIGLMNFFNTLDGHSLRLISKVK